MFSKKITHDHVYRIRLEKGEKVLHTLTAFCAEHNIMHAWISGLGAVSEAQVGYYDLEKRTYESRIHAEAHEVVAMTGNVTVVDTAPFLHLHVVLSNTQNESFGGHLFEATVAVTLEVELVVYKEPLMRVHDGTIGLKVLSCDA